MGEYYIDGYQMHEYQLNNGLEYSTFETFLFWSGTMHIYKHLVPFLDIAMSQATEIPVLLILTCSVKCGMKLPIHYLSIPNFRGSLGMNK